VHGINIGLHIWLTGNYLKQERGTWGTAMALMSEHA